MRNPRLILLALVIVSNVALLVFSRYRHGEFDREQQERLVAEWDSIRSLCSLDSHEITPVASSEQYLLRYPYSSDSVGSNYEQEGMMLTENVEANDACQVSLKTSLDEFDSSSGSMTVSSSMEMTSIRSKAANGEVTAVPAEIKSKSVRESDLLGRGRTRLNQILINTAVYDDRGILVPLALPQDPVGVGSQWTYESDPESGKSQKTGKLQATLSEVVQFDGVLAAKIDAKVETFMMAGLESVLKAGAQTTGLSLTPMQQSITCYVSIPEVRTLWVQTESEFSTTSRVVSRFQPRNHDQEN